MSILLTVFRAVWQTGLYYRTGFQILERMMSFLQWKKDKLKIGKITFFKVKSFQGMFIYYFLGIPVWSRTTPISRIIYEFQKNKNFDTRNFDKELERIIPPVKSMDSSPYTTWVSVLATELYDNIRHYLWGIFPRRRITCKKYRLCIFII